ncbi:hypothetical protein K0504_05945 [Neiella marina]|uniref:Glycosyltransferase n=1 Tax=Neiella holothuriorum TaxID=2870530 RepID=A0ABS7EE26_9GAMM|nr:hypothetical protein [Neiella holothuriorum]MBW8190573.1 hypothetical protein [Neiella holothuriorum]
MSKPSIYLFPFASDRNDYVQLNKRAWSQMGYDVHPISALRPASRQHSVAVLNWFEDQWTTSKKSRFLSWFIHVAKLLLIRLGARKVIWVRHNVVTHSNLTGPVYPWMNKTMMRLMNWCSDERVSHRTFPEFSYVPHPIYDAAQACSSKERDIEFLYFGVVSHYKGLIELLSSWPAQRKLVMLGKSTEQQLTDDIQDVIRTRQLTVEWRNEFVPDADLADAISRSRYVIIPHQDGRMIVSGAFYHAIALGANVLVKKSAFSDWLVGEHGFVTQYQDEQLASVMASLDYVGAEKVMHEANQCYGTNALSESWQRVLSPV